MDLFNWYRIRYEEGLLYKDLAYENENNIPCREINDKIRSCEYIIKGYSKLDIKNKDVIGQYLNILFLYSIEDRIKLRQHSTQVYAIDTELKEAAWLIACVINDHAKILEIIKNMI